MSYCDAETLEARISASERNLRDIVTNLSAWRRDHFTSVAADACSHLVEARRLNHKELIARADDLVVECGSWNIDLR